MIVKMDEIKMTGYTPEVWTESKGYGSVLKETLTLKRDERLELFDSYMLHHTVGYDKQKRTLYYPYSDVATYRAEDGGKIVRLYTEKLQRMVYLCSESEILTTILTHIGRQMLPLDEWILRVYGESGRLLYPKSKKEASTSGQICVYQNYIRSDTEIKIGIISTRDIVGCAVSFDTVTRTAFGVIGKSPFGGAEVVFDMYDTSIRKTRALLGAVKRRAFSTRGEMLVVQDGFGTRISKLFFKSKKPKPLEETLVFSDFIGRMFSLTFYEETMEIGLYGQADGVSRCEERVVAYRDILSMKSTTRVGYPGRLYEITLEIGGQNPECVKILNAGMRAEECYMRAIELLRERLKIYAPDALI